MKPCCGRHVGSCCGRRAREVLLRQARGALLRQACETLLRQARKVLVWQAQEAALSLPLRPCPCMDVFWLCSVTGVVAQRFVRLVWAAQVGRLSTWRDCAPRSWSAMGLGSCAGARAAYGIERQR